MVRSYPNIVITGTPGTGKTSHASLLASSWPSSSTVTPAPLRHINVGDLCKDKGFITSYDEEWKSHEVDEDKLMDHLESLTGERAPEPQDEEDTILAKNSLGTEERGGLLLDWHTCDSWPERWVDLVVVLRCDHAKLWKRLEKREYPLQKIQENNDAEIMQVVLEDARESYEEEAIVELRSEEATDVEDNVERIKAWIDQWRRDRGLEDIFQ
ncbi:unnamed protein product [Sympodiomycopsis kandeliae]